MRVAVQESKIPLDRRKSKIGRADNSMIRDKAGARRRFCLDCRNGNTDHLHRMESVDTDV